MAGMVKIAGLLLVSAVLLNGCSQPKQRSSKVELVSNEQKKQDLLNQIDKRYENPKAHYELGKLYQTNGLWSKAKWEFNIALGFDPIHYKAQAAIVKTALAAGDQTQSEVAAEIYMNQAAALAQASALLGQAFQAELLDEYAIACYRQGLALAPNSAVLNKQVGYYYMSRGDNPKAEMYLTRSFQLDPYQPEVAGALGRMGIVVQIPQKPKGNVNVLDKIFKSKEKEK